MSDVKSKFRTLEETKALFVRALTDWPLNATRRERVMDAILKRELELCETFDELQDAYEHVRRYGKTLVSEGPSELWEDALDAFGINGERDWSIPEVRGTFALWLHEDCGIPTGGDL